MTTPWPELTGSLAVCLADIVTLSPGGKCAIAVSGGPDSVALAAVGVPFAKQLGLQPELWHVHHGLMPMADAWVSQVEALGSALNVPVCVRRVSIPAALRAEQGIEGAARSVRRAVFSTLAQERACQHVLLAQHLDDQAETVLLRLLRGSGLAGMAAMRRRTPWAPGSTLIAWRPWLDVPRREILPAAVKTAEQFGLVLADDPSNLDPAYARGCLRQSVMPALEQHWPGYRQTLARHAELAHDMNEWVEQQAAQDLQSLQDAEGALDVSAWAALVPTARQRLVLRAWLASLGCAMPSAARLAEFERQLLSSAQDRSLRWQHDGRVFGVYRGRCLCLPPDGQDAVGGRGGAQAPDLIRLWQGESVWHCPEFGGYLHFDLVEQGVAPEWLASLPLRLTLKSEGGRLRRRVGGSSRPLKACFQELGIPPWQRQRSPRLWRAEQLLWVAGLGSQSDLPQAGPGIAWRWTRN